MFTAKLLALAGVSLLAFSQSSSTETTGDVHVRVSPSVKTGIESLTQYPTIQMALDHHPMPRITATTHGRVFIHIEPGVYHERIVVSQNHPYVTLLGMGKGPEEVIITNSLDAAKAGGTFVSQTVEVNGSDFEADHITIENRVSSDQPAVALALRSDRSVIKHCRILGKHHTLFADYGRQYYVDTYIEGDNHYVFGNATAVFERSEFHSVGNGTITSHSRQTPSETTGYVVLSSKVTSSHETPHLHIDLGDPWRSYSRTVFIHTDLPAEVSQDGWNDRGIATNRTTAYYGEADNFGPGSHKGERPTWIHVLSRAQVESYKPEGFLAGTDHWNPRRQASLLP